MKHIEACDAYSDMMSAYEFTNLDGVPCDAVPRGAFAEIDSAQEQVEEDSRRAAAAFLREVADGLEGGE